MAEWSRWRILGSVLLLASLGCGGKGKVHDGGTPPPSDAGLRTDGGATDAGGPCPDGGSLCGTTCVDLENDSANCGQCGRACGADRMCSGGQCICTPPTLDCGGTCMDVSADDNRCGSCSNVCTGGEHCVNSTCTASNIKHVVLIVQENHTFDSYFGLYCQQPAGSNPTCNEGRNCCEGAPMTDAAGTTPSDLTDDFNTSGDPNHSQACELEEIDNGAMDRFTQGSDIGSSFCDSACSRPGNFALADDSTVASYWQYADGNALADRYFQPIAGSTSSNDMYFAVAHEQFVDNNVAPMSFGSGCAFQFAGIQVCDGAMPTSYSGRTTIADLLLAAGHSFAVYADGYAEAASAAPSCPSIPNECTWSDLHPINQRSCLYDPSDIPFEYYSQLTDGPSMKDYNDFATDIAHGTLPEFAYIKARTFRNEHPSYSKISDGIAFVTQTIEAVESSPYANNTLVLLTWDEGGGFYDHVPTPPSTDFDDNGNPVPHGTRVPMLAIGPFARKGYISHVVMDHSSIVEFLEYNFLGPVGQLGHEDEVVNNIGSMLDPATTGIVVPATR